MNRWRASTPSRTGGFGLAELMVVVAVIGILSSVVIRTSGSEWRRERANTVAQELAGWLEEVRAASLRQDNAVASAGGCEVTFTPLNSAQAGAVLASSPCLSNRDLLIRGLSSDSSRYFSAVANPGTLVFTPRGTVITPFSNDMMVKIFLANSSILRCVRISSGVGAVRIGSNDSASSAADTCLNFTRF